MAGGNRRRVSTLYRNADQSASSTDAEEWFFVLFFWGGGFWPRCAACGILVPQPGIEPTPPALEVWSLNHWTAREAPRMVFYCGQKTSYLYMKELPEKMGPPTPEEVIEQGVMDPSLLEIVTTGQINQPTKVY